MLETNCDEIHKYIKTRCRTKARHPTRFRTKAKANEPDPLQI